MTPRQSIYPILPSNLGAQFAEQPIQINGMNVEFDQKITLFPAEVVVEKLEHGYRTRPNRNGKSAARRAR